MTVTREGLGTELEALRGPLTGYCYRLLGAVVDTDDAVQETMLRAWRAVDGFDPDRARLSTWVHRIATNVCLDMLRSARRRALVAESGLAEGEMGSPLPPDHWVEPMPDARLTTSADPAQAAVQRETVRLAFIAALQRLAPRQRAVLVLRDVLAYSAAETAEVLDTSVAAVNSALQRARATLEADRPLLGDVLDPDDADQARLVADYVEAFHRHDVARLCSLLRADAVATMPPLAWRMSGAERIASLMAASDACAADRLVPVALNGSPGLAQYRPDPQGVLRPFALVHLQLDGGRIARLVTFLGTGERFGELGLPDRLLAGTSMPSTSPAS